MSGIFGASASQPSLHVRCAVNGYGAGDELGAAMASPFPDLCCPFGSKHEGQADANNFPVFAEIHAVGGGD